MYYGGIEAGGTKFICAVSNEQFEIIEKISIPTTEPDETLAHVFAFFDQFDLKSMGIGTFGPIDVTKGSETYGYITSTPKPGWNQFDFLGQMKRHYPNLPFAWTTDVNAAAYGEYRKGRATDSKSCLYLTVGTGIGGGAILNGKIVEGFGHTEMGHLLVRQHPEDTFAGKCPYHGNCLEGLAAGPAIEARYGKKGLDLANDPKVWELEAYYLAQALVDYTLVLRPEKIILGGGVMKQSQLFQLIREAFKQLMNDYVTTPNLDEYIVSPGLEDQSGIIGCLLLGAEAD